MVDAGTKTNLIGLLNAAIAAAQPEKVLPAFWAKPRAGGKIIGVGAGKAAAAMTFAQALLAGAHAAACLENNDSTGFFSACGGLVNTGLTQTNVNDFRAILIDR